MSRTNLILCFILCASIYSCHSHKSNFEFQNKKQKQDSIQHPSTDTALSNNIEECLPKYLDTVNKMFSVNYINEKKFYEIKIRIKQISQVLDAQFDCRMAGYMVPRFRSYHDSTLCLERGCGMGCVVFYVFQLTKNGVIEYQSFDNGLDIDLVHSNCIILNQKNDSELVVFDYKTGMGFSQKLTQGKSSNDISTLEINDKAIDILFSNNTTSKISFSKKKFVTPISEYYDENRIDIGPHYDYYSKSGSN